MSEDLIYSVKYVEALEAVVEAAQRVKLTAIRDQDCWFMSDQAASDLEKALAKVEDND